MPHSGAARPYPSSRRAAGRGARAAPDVIAVDPVDHIPAIRRDHPTHWAHHAKPQPPHSRSHPTALQTRKQPRSLPLVDQARSLRDLAITRIRLITNQLLHCGLPIAGAGLSSKASPARPSLVANPPARMSPPREPRSRSAYDRLAASPDPHRRTPVKRRKSANRREGLEQAGLRSSVIVTPTRMAETSHVSPPERFASSKLTIARST